MARLTPLAKTLLSVAVIGAASVVGWQLYTGTVTSTAPVPKALENQAAVSPAAAPAVVAPRAAAKGGPLGSTGNPLKVSLVSFHGYAPALVANGNSLTTQPGSVYANQGVNVEFVIQDDIPTLATVFTSGAAQCAWRTSDFWAQEHPNLRNAGLDARAVVVVDNTQGGDAIIARDANIKTVEDLAGRSVALLQFTPSHGLLTTALENSSLSARKRQGVNRVFINAEEGTAGVRAAFAAGNVDAAVLWDPDLALALRDVPGSRVVYSTKAATNLIYDVMVCDARVLDDPANTATIQNFVSGWLQGVEVARSNPDLAVSALTQTQEFFKLLAKDEGRDFVKGLFHNLVWTSLEDNARILGLAGGTNHYERVYRQFDQLYRAEGSLANPNSPVINPQDSFDYRFIKSLLAGKAELMAAAAKPTEVFTVAAREKVVNTTTALVTKPVMVQFASGASALNKRAEQILDTEMVPFIETNGSAYFLVSGNTDSVGSYESNMTLSLARAHAVVNYLVKEWGIDATRLKVVGNGPGRPLCNERSPAAEGLDLEACRAANRTTRVAVFQP